MYLEPSQTSTMELLREILGFKRYIISQKSSIVDVPLGSKYASDCFSHL